MQPHVLICPTAFKGTFSAPAAAAAMAAGAREAMGSRGAGNGSGAAAADVVSLPLADGGNGLLDALRAAGGGELRVARVAGPLGDPVRARYLVQRERVVVETAEACGLHLVPAGRRDPLLATTAGVGDLLREAAASLGGEGDLVVGLGGSATVDAGAGMAAALGWSLLDEDGEPILPCGSGLLRLERIRPPAEPVPLGALRVLADVTNPLLGPAGAAAVYAPQKGASARDVAVLERALGRWADVVRRDLGPDVRSLPGGGAAGGLGAAFAALLGAPPTPGARWLLDVVAFDRRLEGARAVVTGEGAWDEQSMMGKVTGEVIGRARSAGVPVVVVAGAFRAPLPEGALGVGGEASGARLDAEAIARLTREALGRLLGRTGGR